MLMSISNSAIVLSVCSYNNLIISKKDTDKSEQTQLKSMGDLQSTEIIGIVLVFNTGAHFSGERSTK